MVAAEAEAEEAAPPPGEEAEDPGEDPAIPLEVELAFRAEVDLAIPREVEDPASPAMNLDTAEEAEAMTVLSFTVAVVLCFSFVAEPFFGESSALYDWVPFLEFCSTKG